MRVPSSTEMLQQMQTFLDGVQGETVLDARQLPEHAAYMLTAIQYRNAECPVG